MTEAISLSIGRVALFWCSPSPRYSKENTCGYSMPSVMLNEFPCFLI